MSTYNWLIENIILPCGDLVFGGSYAKYLRQVRKLVNLNEVELQYYQSNRLGQILSVATQRSSYYNALNIPSHKDAFEWLKMFPILEKETIRDTPDKLITANSNNLIKNFTSGSTGLQTVVYVNKKEQSFYRAAQTVWWEWAGYYPGHPILQTGLAPTRSIEKRLKDFFFRTNYLFAFGLKDADIKKVFDWARQRHSVLGGYASSLYVLSEASKGEPPVRFKSAVSWGDKLFDHYRKSIESNFGCRVFETYGAGEGLMIAAQKDLDYMYIMSPCVYLEIVDEEGNEVNDGELGYVVVTSLIAESMPLIRYKLGDLAIKLPKSKYPENRDLSLPLLEKVIGRETDIIHTPSGKKLIVHSFTGIFEYYSEVKQFCVHQKTIQGVEILYIRGKGFDSSVLGQIKMKILELLDEPFVIDFREVEVIPPTKSGKPQIVITELNFSGRIKN